MARAAGKTMKVDVALPLEMFETVSRIAKENNAPIHHRSGEPVISPTIVRLIGLGILSVTDNPELMTADLSRPMSGIDPRVDALLDRVKALEDKLSDIISPIPSLTEDQVTTICELAMQGWPSITDDHIRELVRAEVERLVNNGPKPASTATTSKPKASTTKPPASMTDEDLKMVRRFEANPEFKDAVAEAIGQGGSSAEISQRLLEAGFGTTNGKAHNPSVITRMRKALAYLEADS